MKRSLEKEQAAQNKKENWQEDADAKVCSVCNKPFTFMKRRHHCRRCGLLVCSRCSTAKRLDRVRAIFVRVCNNCISNEYEVVVESRPFGSTFASSVSPNKLRATYVVNVVHGLSAHQGGLREGSRLVEIDGTNVEGKSFKAIRKKIAEAKLPFTLRVSYDDNEEDYLKLKAEGEKRKRRKKQRQSQGQASRTGRSPTSSDGEVQSEDNYPQYYSMAWLGLFTGYYAYEPIQHYIFYICTAAMIIPCFFYFGIFSFPTFTRERLHRLNMGADDSLPSVTSKDVDARTLTYRPISTETSAPLESKEKKRTDSESIDIDHRFAIRHETWGSWTTSDASLVRVRGKEYLADREKFPSLPALFKIAKVELIECEDSDYLVHWTSRPESWMQKNIERLKENVEMGVTYTLLFPSFNSALSMNFVVPLEGCGCPRLEDMLRKFLDPIEEKFRKDRLKLVPKIVKGPWLFRNAVPNGAAIIAKNLPTSYFFEDGCMEITMHPEVNVVAAFLIKQARGIAKSLVVDINWLLESVTYEELPERILAGVQIRNVDFGGAIKIVVPEEFKQKMKKNGKTDECTINSPSSQESAIPE